MESSTKELQDNTSLLRDAPVKDWDSLIEGLLDEIGACIKVLIIWEPSGEVNEIKVAKLAKQLCTFETVVHEARQHLDQLEPMLFHGLAYDSGEKDEFDEE